MFKAIKAFIVNTIRESFWRYAVECDGNLHYAFTYEDALDWARQYNVRVFGKVSIYNDKRELIAQVA